MSDVINVDTENDIHGGLADLARFIRDARIEIAAIQPNDINTDHIPKATDELDAVVSATEDATNKIMDICEEISELAATCPIETAEKLVSCTTRLFEACNFQDITGQRITKVVNTLKQIDGKVGALLKVFGPATANVPIPVAAQPNDEASLLNGPALPANAVDQAEIDRMLAEM